MKALALLVFLSSVNALAFNSVYLECKATDPCKFADDGLKGCVTTITVAGREGGQGSVTVNYRHKMIGAEVLLTPTTDEVLIGTSAGGLSYQDMTGDQWGVLNRVVGGKFEGSVTVDQDFEFEVTCTDKAIGFE